MKMKKASLKYPKQTISVKSNTERLVDYIRRFDGMNGLKSGSTYIIHGKEVVV